METWNQAASWAFLFAGGVTVLATVAVHLFRVPYTPVQYVYYLVAMWLVRLQWRARLPKSLDLPAGKGAIVICNHRSSVDPFFLQVIAPGPIRWMVAREFCEHPGFRWFLKPCNVIPVNRRGIDTAATKSAIRTIQQGGWVGMLPEGRINLGEELMLPGRPGAVMIALKAKAPILPCFILGSPYDQTPWSPFFMSARVELRVGEMIDLSEYHGRDGDRELVAKLMLRCLRVMAALADRPDFEPQLAGRRWLPDAEAQPL